MTMFTLHINDQASYIGQFKDVAGACYRWPKSVMKRSTEQEIASGALTQLSTGGLAVGFEGATRILPQNDPKPPKQQLSDEEMVRLLKIANGELPDPLAHGSLHDGA